MDIFDRIRNDRGPLGQHAKETHGYFTFPKLEGEISNHMTFRGKEVLVWSVNNYLGLSNHPEVRKVDADASARWGMGYPMGARMMSGQTSEHEALENELSEFMQKEDSFLLNFGYQGCQSAIEALVCRHDVIVYDSESHACMVDGVRLHQGKKIRFHAQRHGEFCETARTRKKNHRCFWRWHLGCDGRGLRDGWRSRESSLRSANSKKNLVFVFLWMMRMDLAQ